MNKNILFLILLFCTNIAFSQSLPGSGNAYEYLNDNAYIEVNPFQQINFPFTVSFWVKASAQSGYQTIFASESITSGYAGFWLNISPSFEIGISTGSGSCFEPYCRRTIQADIPLYYEDKWIHLVGIFYSINNGALFLNGQSLNLKYNGSGPLNMLLTNNPVGTIGKKIRYNSFFAPLVGQMDELIIWNRALSQNEIREYMCKKVPTNAPNLVAYYKFDEPDANGPVIDSSPNAYNGTHVNGGSRGLSGAYIGDESTFDYTLNQNTQHINSLGDTVTISNTSNNVNGVQIYTVLDSPNTYNGIGNDTFCLQDRYHGVYFSQATANNPTADISISGGNPPYGGVYWRTANDDPLWKLVTVGQTSGNIIDFPIDQNQELIILEGSQIPYQSGLPATIKTCDFPFVLSVNDFPGGTLSWSNGSIGKDVQIDSLGTYILNAYSNCDTSNFSDTVEVIQPNEYTVIDTSAQVCQGDTFKFSGNIYTQTGFYSDTVVSSSSCDSIYNVDLLVIPNTQLNIYDSVCPGQYYVLPGGDSVNTAGSYPDTLLSSEGCDSIVVVDLSILPIFSDTLNISICAFESYTLPDGRVVDESGTYISMLTSIFGCDSNVVSILSVPQYSNFDTICLGDNYILPGGDTVSSSGTYIDTFSSSGLCDSTVITHLTTLGLQISIYADSVLCHGDSSGAAMVIIDSSAIPPFDYQWSNNANDSSITNLTSGMYSLTVTDAHDCSAVDSVEVFQPETVSVNAGEDVLISLGDNTYLEVILSEGGSPPYTYSWTPDRGLDNQSGIRVTASPDSTTAYIVTLIDDNGCITTDTVLVEVNPNLFIFPEGFTPNGDGHNDTYEILISENVEVVEFKIYNRWGELIHSDNKGRWNGYYKGALQSMDNYLYRAKLKLPDGAEVDEAGDFVLVR
ncbi:MAG: LamG-like jellyroll fold domain-containing protein [Chitinophagales bacterium]